MDIQYRFLGKKYFAALYETHHEAFSDYVVPLQMTEIQFANHIAQNNIDLKLSVGAFAGGRLVGYTLNGFGRWDGIQTAYDAGTGVIPDYRRKGIGRSLFEFLFPKLREIGIRQMLLEVISSNERAIELYRKLGFEETRKLLFFEQTGYIESSRSNGIRIRQIEEPVWDYLKLFWDKETSWQFSVEAIARKITSKSYYGAFCGSRCVAYSVLHPDSGIISQIAVDKEHRRKKVATMLLVEMQEKTKDGQRLRFSNVDTDLQSLIRFAGKLDFTPTISQYEMILKL